METFSPNEKNLGDRSASDAARYVIWITLLIAVCALTLFANLEGRDLWGADESRHAERAREMMASRQWMTPTYLGQPDFDKPPVHYWLMTAAGQLLGPSDAVFCLPSAVFGLATVLMTFARALPCMDRARAEWPALSWRRRSCLCTTLVWPSSTYPCWPASRAASSQAIARWDQKRGGYARPSSRCFYLRRAP